MNKNRGHLLFRIFLTYLITAILIVVSLAFAFHVIQSERKLPAIVEQNAVNYLLKLHDEFILNPSIENKKSIENKLGFQMQITGFEAFSENSNLPSFEELKNGEHGQTADLSYGRIKGYFFITLKSAKPQMAWFVSSEKMKNFISAPFLWIVGFIILILAMSFFSVRWIMLPIRTVLSGVDRITNGDLKFRIIEGHRGEFYYLASRFNRMADRLEKMIEAKDQLLRDVSHELRSPLARLNVATDLMKDESLKSAMKEDLNKMNQMVNEVLESYRIRQGHASLKRVETNLSELISRVTDEYSEQAPGLKINIKPEVRATVDPMLIERVFRNLIENAFKYSNKSSKSIVVSLAIIEKEIHFSVRDFGIGIEAKDLPHIFEPFYRADSARTPSTDGFGLGLSISKAIVDAHHGKIEVKSIAGQGSEFLISLPTY